MSKESEGQDRSGTPSVPVVDSAAIFLWLDDVRPAPRGWTLVKTAAQARALLATGEVVEASLDHDLGGAETGYDVLAWVETAMAEGAWYGPLPEIHVHSSNPVGRARMFAAIESIQQLHADWQESAA
jgi:hypothetical protein